MEELIQAFSMEHVAKNPAVFEIDKLNWINQHYMRQLDEEAFFAAAKPHMVAAGYMTGDECGEKLEWLKRVVATAKEHVAFAAQILNVSLCISVMNLNLKMQRLLQFCRKNQYQQ